MVPLGGGVEGMPTMGTPPPTMAPMLRVGGGAAQHPYDTGDVPCQFYTHTQSPKG
jgi:hypothetical protein